MMPRHSLGAQVRRPGVAFSLAVDALCLLHGGLRQASSTCWQV